MDNTHRTSTPTAGGSADQLRLDRPLPPFPPNSQQDELTVDPREIMYRGFGGTSVSASDDRSFQNEHLRQDYTGNPSGFFQGVSVLTPRSESSQTTSSSESRSRGSSASQAHSADEMTNAQETARLIRALRGEDSPERYRASSSTSSRLSMHSALSNRSSDAASGSREPSASQSRYRRSPSGRSEVVVPRWQPDIEATCCPICNTQFSTFPSTNSRTRLMIF
jgi:hypothetical protein